MKPVKVVVVGDGFAAVQFAKTLRAKLRAAECTMLDHGISRITVFQRADKTNETGK